MRTNVLRGAALVQAAIPVLHRHGLTLDHVVACAAALVPLLDRYGVFDRPAPAPVSYPDLPAVVEGLPEWLPIIEDPIPEPPPPAPRPWTKHLRGIFARGPGHMFYMMGSASDAAWMEDCRWCQDRGDTTILLGLNSRGYLSQRGFNWWATPDRAVARAEMARECGLEPTWVLHDDSGTDDAPREDQRGALWLRHWRQAADVIRPHVKVCLPGFEINYELSLKDQWLVIQEMARLFPDAYRLVSFTDDRWAMAHPNAYGPGGDMPAGVGEEFGFWRSAGPLLHGLAFQAPMELVDDEARGHWALRNRLAQFCARLSGVIPDEQEFPETHRDYMQKFGGAHTGHDVHFWEGGAEWVLKGRRDPAWCDRAGRDVLRYQAGVIGCSDGWKG